MSKWKVWALGLLASVCLIQSASAQAVWVHKVFDNVGFRTHAAAIVGNDACGTYCGKFGVDGMGGYVDSTFASGIAKFDTTATINTVGWTKAPYGSSVTDSAMTCKLIIYDAGLATVTLGKTSATAESIYVKAQVSANDADWHDLSIMPGGAPVLNAFTVQTTVNAAVLTFTSSTNTGVSGKMWSIRYCSEQYIPSLRSGQDIYHIDEFPFVRFIVMGSRSLNHSYKAMVVRWGSGAGYTGTGSGGAIN